MSFNDFNSSYGSECKNQYSGQDSIRQIGDSLQSFQSSGSALKQKIITLRRRHVNVNDKSMLDMQVRSLKELENNIKFQLDKELRRADALSKNDGTQARVALLKLQKDFERVKQGIQGVVKDASAVELSREEAVMGGVSIGTGEYTESGPRLVQAMQGREVDEAIMAERERDIKRINEDLVLVKEMFRDMAELVDSQGSAITEIADKTESSHERAKAGLVQVQQAAGHQPGCLIS